MLALVVGLAFYGCKADDTDPKAAGGASGTAGAGRGGSAGSAGRGSAGKGAAGNGDGAPEAGARAEAGGAGAAPDDGTPPGSAKSGDVTVLVSDGYSINQIVIDDANVYWIDTGASSAHAGLVGTVGRNGGAPVTLAKDLENPSGLAVDAEYVYFTLVGASAGSSVSPGTGSVMRVPITGGEPTELASNQSPSSMTIDAEYVYWTNASTGTFDDAGSLMRVPLAGGSPETVTTGLIQPDGLHLIGSTLVWSSYAGRISSLPSKATTPVVLATESELLLDSTVYSDSIYYTVYGVNGALREVGLDGSEPKDIVAGMTFASGLAVDKDGIYFNSRGLRRVGFDGGAPVDLMPHPDATARLAEPALSELGASAIALSETEIYAASGPVLWKEAK